jgi:aspartate/methionine/tyrosine aminotransferase
MKLEIWFDRWQYHCTKDIGESAVKWKSVSDLEAMGIDMRGLEFRYGHHTGLPELKEEIVNKQYPGFTTKNILVTSGGSESIFCFYGALANKGDNIVVEGPNYPSNYGIPAGLGLDVTRYHLEYDTNFKMDVEKLKSLVKPNTRVISITHPNNPTGSIISETQLRDLASFCESKDIMLLSDETYRNMYEGEAPIPAAMINKNCASITSMSKCYGLPGCRVGWIVSQNEELLENMLTVREYISISNNTVGEALSLEMLKRRDGVLEQHIAHTEKNKRFIADWIQNHEHLEWVVPEVGIVGFPRFKDATVKRLDLEKFYVHLAEHHKTFVVPGDRLDCDPRYFRVGFGGDDHDVKEGTASFDVALNEVLAAVP